MSEILFNPTQHYEVSYKKMDKDEKIVRKTLLNVWMRILEGYARPGVTIPPVEVVRRELLEKGVNAAAQAVADAHWYLPAWAARGEIEQRVKGELNRFDLTEFLYDVRIAQDHPERQQILDQLREKVKYYVLDGN